MEKGGEEGGVGEGERAKDSQDQLTTMKSQAPMKKSKPSTRRASVCMDSVSGAPKLVQVGRNRCRVMLSAGRGEGEREGERTIARDEGKRQEQISRCNTQSGCVLIAVIDSSSAWASRQVCSSLSMSPLPLRLVSP